MSTDQVPGAEPLNNDELHVGCWAEHKDGSMILVEGLTDDGIVVFSMFDFADKKNPLEYRSSMAVNGFNKSFSYKDGDKNLKEKWTWHDKTQFPWDRVMSHLKDGVKDISAEKTLTAASRIIDSLETRVKINPLTKKRARELQRYVEPSLASKVVQRIQKAISGLGVSEVEHGEQDNEIVIRVVNKIADNSVSRSKTKRVAQSARSKAKQSRKGARNA